MSKKYLNGWQAPYFIISGAGVNTVVDLKLRYQAMTEYVEETYIEHELLDGSIVEKFLYAHYYWELNYSALAESSELIKIRNILNYLQKGCAVLLKPHKDIERYFTVTTVKDRRTLGRHYGGLNSPGEKDFSITFKTLKPSYSPGSSINWIDLNDLSLPASKIFNQYYYLSDEAGDYLFDEDGFPVLVSAE